MLEIGRV